MIFHEVAEISLVGLDGRRAVTLLFQQFKIAFRQHIFPFWLGMAYIYTAVVNIGVRRIAVIEGGKAENGGWNVAGAVHDRSHVGVLCQQQGYGLAVRVVHPDALLTVVPVFMQDDAATLF